MSEDLMEVKNNNKTAVIIVVVLAVAAIAITAAKVISNMMPLCDDGDCVE